MQRSLLILLPISLLMLLGACEGGDTPTWDWNPFPVGGRDSGTGSVADAGHGAPDAGSPNNNGGGFPDAGGGGPITPPRDAGNNPVDPGDLEDGGNLDEDSGSPIDAGGDGDGDTDPEPPLVSGCGDTVLYKSPDDPAKPGPWPVGVRTVKVPFRGGELTAEIWYPAVRGSEAGKDKATYDLTHWLWDDAKKIPPAQNRAAECNCYRDLPIDANHGPYPAVIFLHGLASFRVASASTMTQWASRGFIVIAADHWGMYLSDVISCPGRPSGPGEDRNRDVDAMIAALTNKTGDLAFLGSTVDVTRLGISGHSMGGQGAGNNAAKPGVRVVIPIAQLGGGGVRASNVESALFVCGMNDSVNNYTTATKAGYNATTVKKKRLVGITAANHLDVTDLCVERNSEGKPAIQVARENGVCSQLALAVVAGLAQCGNMRDPTQGPGITNYVTTAALEEVLHCRDHSASFAALKSKFSAVGEFLESR